MTTKTELLPSKGRVAVSWSSGKDSAWGLHQLLSAAELTTVSLFTSCNAAFDRVAMHGVRQSVLKAQAEALNLPLHIIDLPWPCSNQQYSQIMTDFVQQQEHLEIDYFAFGDLFLEDIRQYRVAQMAASSINCIFPLWQKPTAALAREMIEQGLKAVITCVDPKQLDPRFVGREFDHALLDNLPKNVDPCGENGEFHTLVYDSPDFQQPLALVGGEILQRDGFWFADFSLV